MMNEYDKPTGNQLLTVEEIAALLSVHVSWVYGRLRKRSRDRLPAYRLGKYWRFRAEEVLAWVQRHGDGHEAV
jgi:excisionase family DNA binding protein